MTSIWRTKGKQCLAAYQSGGLLGIHDNGQLFLIEVKNYRGHTHDEETRNVLQAKGDELMRRIAVKVRDTIATVIGSARFPQMTKHFLPKSTNCWLMTGRR